MNYSLVVVSFLFACVIAEEHAEEAGDPSEYNPKSALAQPRPIRSMSRSRNIETQNEGEDEAPELQDLSNSSYNSYEYDSDVIKNEGGEHLLKMVRIR